MSMISIPEQERLLKKRAQRYLEKQGYKLKSSQGGGFQIQSALTGEPVAGENFELNIYDVGRFAGICGYSTKRNEKADITSAEAARKNMIYRQNQIPDKIDPQTGKYTPEYAATLEKNGTL